MPKDATFKHISAGCAFELEPTVGPGGPTLPAGPGKPVAPYNG